MPELEKVPEKEIEKEALLEKCLFGDTYDPQRGKACIKLAEICRTEIDKLSSGEQAYIRQSIIDDASFKNYEDITDTVEISGREFPRIYTEPSLFNGALFDYDKYIKDNKEEKLGFCNLALYGLESQFVEQIDKGFFQTVKNSRDLFNAENLILNPDIEILDDPEIVAHSLTRDEVIDLLRRLEPAIDITLHGREYRHLEPYVQEKITNIIKADMEHRRFIRSVKNPKDVTFEICNVITNPKVEKDKYNVCSVATLDGKMYFTINGRILIREAFKTDTWEDVKGVNMNEIWRATRQEDRLKILEIAGIKRTAIYSDYDGFISKDEKAIWDAYQTFSHEEILEMIEPQPAEYKFKELGKLKCIHNMLGLVEYPEAIKKRWLQLILDYEEGLITKESYKTLVSELAKLEKDFAEEISRANLKEGEASKKFTKPTEYQPSRLRIYGLQRYLNTLFNSVLVENPLAVVDNSYVIGEIGKSFKSYELKQLKDNMLFSESELKKAKRLARYKPDDIWAVVYPIAAEQIRNRECDSIDERIDSASIHINYGQLLEIIGRDWKNDKKNWGWECGTSVDIDREEHPHAYMLASGTESELEEYWNFETEEPDLELYADKIIEEYPDLNISDIEFILKINDAVSNTFYADIEWLAYRDYFEIESMAVDYLSELPFYIKDIAIVKDIARNIAKILKDIADNSDTVSIFGIPYMINRFEQSISSPYGAIKDGHYTTEFRDWIKGQYDRDFDEEIIFDYEEIVGKIRRQ